MKPRSFPCAIALVIVLGHTGCTSPAPPAEAVAPSITPPVATPPAPPEEIQNPAPEPAPATLSEIDLTTFFDLRSSGKALIYDVRPSWLYHLGHIDGAISLPGNSFAKRFPVEEAIMKQAVTDGQTIVVYCTDVDCPDGHTVGGWIAERGIPLCVYRGGWEEWKSAGLE